VTDLLAQSPAGADAGWTLAVIHPAAVVGVAGLAGWYLWHAHRRAAQTPSPVGVPASGPDAPAAATSTSTASAAPTVAQRAAFAAGLLTLLATLSGPLRDLGDRFLASAHALQLLLLVLVAPPLLLLGTPAWMLRPLLARRPVAAAARVLTRPVMAFALFGVALVIWHMPLLYNLALANPAVHALEHLTILGAALLMWWPLVGSLPELPRLAYPGQMLYSFLLSLPVTLVAMSIVKADELLYPAYALAPRVWGISPMTDQQVAGIILGVPGVLFFYGVLSVAFFRWSQLQADEPPGPPHAPSGAHG